MLAIDNKGDSADVMLPNINRFELSLDRKKLLVQRGSDIYVIDAGVKPPSDLSKSQVSLRGWVGSASRIWRYMCSASTRRPAECWWTSSSAATSRLRRRKSAYLRYRLFTIVRA